jgi:hypothetical protein
MLRIGFALLGALAVVSPSVSGKTQTPTADHRWAGIVFDAFAWDTGSGQIEAWTAEDGGRIRHRRPADGVWEFQDVHDPVRDTLHRVTFLTSGPQAGDLGWAVGQGGWVLKTTSGGAPSGSTPGWQPACPQFPTQASSGDDPFEELYDVHFVNATDGWLCGKHSLWWTSNGGTTWTAVSVVDPGPPATFLDLADFELYALDVVERGGSRLGLAVMEPGIVLRSDSTQSGPNLTQWQVVFDMRDLCPSGGDVDDCLNATGGVFKGCECEVCAPAGVGGPHFEPWDVEISRNEAPGMKLALFTGGIVFQCGMVFSRPTTA